MISTRPGATETARIEGPPAGLTITARLVDGDETLPTALVVSPVLDDNGDPIDAYKTGAFVVPATLPVGVEWLLDGARVGYEVIQAGSSVSVGIVEGSGGTGP